jgi:5-methylcytosine-specific restriction endonuclease McrA
MALPVRPPSHDHIKPRSRGHTLAGGNRAVVCVPCNVAKGSRTLSQVLYRLARAGDRRAAQVEAFLAMPGPAAHRPAGGSYLVPDGR